MLNVRELICMVKYLFLIIFFFQLNLIGSENRTEIKQEKYTSYMQWIHYLSKKQKVLVNFCLNHKKVLLCATIASLPIPLLFFYPHPAATEVRLSFRNREKWYKDIANLNEAPQKIELDFILCSQKEYCGALVKAVNPDQGQANVKLQIDIALYKNELDIWTISKEDIYSVISILKDLTQKFDNKEFSLSFNPNITRWEKKLWQEVHTTLQQDKFLKESFNHNIADQLTQKITEFGSTDKDGQNQVLFYFHGQGYYPMQYVEKNKDTTQINTIFSEVKKGRLFQNSNGQFQDVLVALRHMKSRLRFEDENNRNDNWSIYAHSRGGHVGLLLLPVLCTQNHKLLRKVGINESERLQILNRLQKDQSKIQFINPLFDFPKTLNNFASVFAPLFRFFWLPFGTGFHYNPFGMTAKKMLETVDQNREKGDFNIQFFFADSDKNIPYTDKDKENIKGLVQSFNGEKPINSTTYSGNHFTLP